MARTSPRKKGATAKSTSAKDSQVGRRCRICDGRPLKASCACTLNPDGTRRIKKRARKATEPTQSNTPASLPLPTDAPPQTWSPPQSIGANTSIGPGHVSFPEPHPVHQPVIDPLLSVDDVSPLEESITPGPNSSLASPTPPPSSPIRPSPSLACAGDPFATGPTPIVSTSLSNGHNMLSFNLDTDDDDSDDSDDDGDSNAPPSTPSRSVGSQPLRASPYKELSSPAYRAARKAWKVASMGPRRAPRQKKPALHGFVGGCMQGSLPLEIRRQKPLRPVMIDGAQASRRFMREMKFVIGRAERVALETGSWVFVGGQQPQSRSNFIHFSSNAMRTHAFEETQKLTNQFSSLISDLREARINGALAAQQTLRKTQTAFELFQEQVKKAMEDKDRQTEYLVGMVEALQQQLGMPAPALFNSAQEGLNHPVASGSTSI